MCQTSDCYIGSHCETTIILMNIHRGSEKCIFATGAKHQIMFSINAKTVSKLVKTTVDRCDIQECVENAWILINHNKLCLVVLISY